MSTPRASSLTPFRAALGYSAAKKEPLRSLIVVIPADHAFAPDRIADRLADGMKPDLDIIVACAGQPADLAAIHAHLPTAQFLLAPAGTSGEDLRALALAQAAGDIVTLVSGVPAGATSALDRDSAARRAMPGGAPLRLSVIVPVHNGGALLDETLSAIVASNLTRESYEVIVVDDASADDSATAGARHADTLVRLAGRPRGPAYARNRGAEQARGETLAFVDADVRMHRDTLSNLLASLADDSGLAAVGASNDGSGADGGFAAQYWNALQQYGAQRYGGLGMLFSAACGAVRRTAMVSVGMFNEWVFRSSSLEDLELGQRMHRVGQRVLLRPDVTVSHLRPRGVGDILSAAWNRSGLLVRCLGYGATRRRARGHMVHTLCAAPTLAALAGSAAAFAAARILHMGWIAPLVLSAALLVMADQDVFRFFSRRRGAAFAIAVVPLHIAAQFVAIAGLFAGWVLHHTVGDPAPDATTQAFAEMGVQVWPPVPRKP
jgi:GT2 family glycosyltransferase